MKNKRISFLSLLLALAMSVSMSGCSFASQNAGNESEASEKDGTLEGVQEEDTELIFEELEFVSRDQIDNWYVKENQPGLGYIDYSGDVKRECIVAVLDAGIDVENENLKGFSKDVKGWNFVADNDQLYDNPEEFHGNFVAGILGELCTENVKLMPVKVMADQEGQEDQEGGPSGQLSSLIEGIKYAEENGASICNISASVYMDDPALKEVIENSQMLFVVPAGNMGFEINSEFMVYPTYYGFENVITVAAIDEEGNLWEGSNYGKDYVDVAAPGVMVGSFMYEDKYAYLSGTSFAAPMVAAEAAMLFGCSNNPLAAKQLKGLICNTVTEVDSLEDTIKSGGYVNFEKALHSVL